jgi:murein DD-endopeptidase MepM/ murein hydrolase activator NlpD
MKRLRTILLIVGIACIALVVARPLFVTANTSEINNLNAEIEQKRKKIEQLEKSIETYKDRVREKQLEASSLSNQLAILDNRRAQVELDIELTENKLAALNLEIAVLEGEITQTETQIDTQKVIIGELVRTIYYNQEKNILEIIAAYDTFSDFYNQLQYLYTIEQDLGSSAKNLRLAKEELESQHEQKEGVKLAYIDVQEELEAKREELEEQSFLKQHVLAQTEASERQFQTLIGSLRAQYQQIENEIQNIEEKVRQRLTEQERLQELDELVVGDPTKLSWPVPSRYVTARFRDPDYPYRHVFEHNAIDIRASQGTPLKAAASGYVARAKQCSTSSCYSFIMLIHNNGLSTVYGHVSRLAVTEDQFVARGDVIGYSGGTPGTVGAGPFVTGPHLHFEVRKNGIPVDPLGYLIRDWE